MQRVLLVLAALSTGAAHGSEYLPEPCAQSPHPPPSWFNCPVPYVEMIPDGTNEIFKRAWYCQETDMALGFTETGCGGSSGLAMFDGWSLPAKAKDQETVFVLFDEFMQMTKDGVFLDGETIKFLEEIKYELPNTIRGDNKPGGFFARPPGSDWLKRVQDFRDRSDEAVCFDIPELPSETNSVCGFELLTLQFGAMGLIDGTSFDDLNSLDAAAAKFWLAKICYENPGTCAPGS